MRLLALALILAGCAKKTTPPPEPVVEPNTEQDTEPDTEAPVCWTAPSHPDRVRYAVISHPFAGPGENANAFEVLSLSADGTLEPTGTHFEMGRNTDGSIVFSPDGHLGVAVQADGSLGLFTLDDDGTVTVIADHLGLGQFYAKHVSIDPVDGTLWVVDGNWPNNGGGVYRLPLNCHTLETGRPERVLQSKLAVSLILDGSGPDILVASAIAGSIPGDDIHLLELGPIQHYGSGQNLDDKAIRSGVARAGHWLLVADNSAFSGIPHRVAISELHDDHVSLHATFEIEDPFDITISPFGNAALVTSGIRNAVIRLAFDGTEWTKEERVSRPRLPGRLVTISHPPLTGRVFVAENLGVRQLQFDPDGSVSEVGYLDFGNSESHVVGGIGVQP